MGWIKSDSELERTDKFIDFVVRLKVGTRDAFWNLHHLWFWINERHPEGVLKGVNDTVIARQSDWTGDSKAFVDALIGSGFLERGEGALFVHEWDQWRPDSARLKSRRLSDEIPTNVGKTSAPDNKPSSLLVLSFPVSGKEENWPLREDYLKTLGDLYPGVDALLECKKALNWLETNPTRRKTVRGMSKFLAGWMERCQNRGGRYHPKTSAEKDAEFDDEMKRVQANRERSEAMVRAYVRK